MRDTGALECASRSRRQFGVRCLGMASSNGGFDVQRWWPLIKIAPQSITNPAWSPGELRCPISRPRPLVSLRLGQPLDPHAGVGEFPSLACSAAGFHSSTLERSLELVQQRRIIGCKRTPLQLVNLSRRQGAVPKIDQNRPHNHGEHGPAYSSALKCGLNPS